MLPEHVEVDEGAVLSPGIHQYKDDGERVDCDIEAWFDVKPYEDGLAYANLMTTSIVIVLLLSWMVVFHSNATRFAQRISGPLQAISKDMNRVSRLVFKENQAKSSNTIEVQDMQNAFYKMKNAIQSFSKYVPREIVLNMTLHQKMAKLGVVPRTITIFFSDIAGFTSICETLQPNEILKMLSEYFTLMTEVIIDHEGILLEFIGDAILAIWNAPYDIPNHAVACLMATLKMQKALKSLNERWAKIDIPNVSIRCAIHTDEVFVGNLGAPDRMKYGVMGDGVNLASRLEELNKLYGTKHLISDKTYNSLGVKEQFVLRHIDKVVVKGRSKATDLYEIICVRGEQISESHKEFIRIYSEGMVLYFNREFALAKTKFDEARETKESKIDLSCDLLGSRCANYISNPPPQAWDGASILLSK